jgi:PTS system galactitol-specific IIC component
MQALNHAVAYVLSFKPYVLLPIIIFILALVFRIKMVVAIKSALAIGIGFIGIFMVFDYFVGIIHPVVEALIMRAGLHFNVLDTGWPPLSAITWSFALAPVLVAILMVTNIAMLLFRLTKTVNIDIWNYWHVILASAMVHYVTKSYLGSVVTGVVLFVTVLKLAEWSAPAVRKFSGMPGICIPHLSGITYLPLAVAANTVIDKIPFVNRIDVNPESMRARLGLIGEPMILGFLMGALLGIFGGYSLKQTGELAFGFAAVIFILPMMCGILGSALIPVSEGMKEFIQRNLPKLGQTYIGLDVAVLFGIPSVVVTSLLLMPIALILAFALPGIAFIPLGDLTNLVVPVAFISLASQGNVFRSILIGIPVIIGNLYFASNLASLFTDMASSANYHIAGYHGQFTSFLDGGNLWRGWVMTLIAGEWIAYTAIPVVLLLLILTRKVMKNRAPEVS